MSSIDFQNSYYLAAGLYHGRTIHLIVTAAAAAIDQSDDSDSNWKSANGWQWVMINRSLALITGTPAVR